MSSGHDRVQRWLKANRGDATQEWLASDIERVTGWHITRDRYSRYESGSLPIGKKVRSHFVDYWASRGVPGPDDQPAPVIGEPGLATHLPGLSDLASAISELVAELRAARLERADLLERVEALETAARLRDRSGAGAAGRPTAPAQRGA